MQKVLIIGGNGMLGHKLVQVLSPEFEVYVTLRRPLAGYEKFERFSGSKTFDNVNLMESGPIDGVLRELRPNVVINAAGIIKQVPSAGNVIETLTINSILPHRLAALSCELGFRLITIGTDCVFSGAKGNYSEDDISDAADLYGKSKNLGEVTDGNCLTFRTSIIGRELGTKHGLLEWFLQNRGGKVSGYSKAIFSGFPTIVFSRIIGNILVHHPNLSGMYHVSSDAISKLDLLRLIDDRFRTNIEIEPNEDVRIDRSLNSERFRSSAGFRPPRWREMIDQLAEDSDGYDAK
ncbi:MAG: SDR family oxidoreductase [Acidobacteriota bacterium]